ncbi:methylmalonyl-CoA epimerase [Salimicrobium jeotgali]|uniref:Methylmalonyl-CoA epimerase n=2 Tax=Salimicrobium TaxID=351195 RepID=K2G758_9BACI|nr:MULTISPECIES: methylmalonyl-CoA epimerase [Salimicrobium]AKG04356.1 methylmalonyl-CoA epimerase [Salimicrobium jeotgali]EKE31023.1 methylmalonyl-CoA mutase small subunit [Salimicrobium jeotgali]MBM7697462.1 methylmalonyl-CoA mutase C-terminal domain/subunit [Salimicrobium jeotgali]PBB05051.1 methylmalonyl-CoA epimerase [Salimicrobium humidisoli]
MEPIRVLIAKPGLDGHDRGALIIAQGLRDAGMEVIYTGLRQSPEQIAQAAIQEDVNVIGLSSLSGAHKTLFPKVVEALRANNAEDIPVIGGGVIPTEDIPYLEEKGVRKIFTSGTAMSDTATFIKQLVQGEETPPPNKISHIGIAVQHLEQALPFYQHSLGLPLESVETVEEEKVKVAFFPIGDTRIELLEPMDEDSPIQKFIDKKGEGIHHIALDVDNIEKRISLFKEQGISMLNETPKQGAHDSRIAFLHPKAGQGVLYELCEEKQEG